MNKSPAAATSGDWESITVCLYIIYNITVYFCEKLIQADVKVNAFTKISSGRKPFKNISDEKMFN